MLRFVDWLRNSKTCPKYDAGLIESKALLEKANSQLPACKELMLSYPDDLKLSLRLVYRGKMSILLNSKFIKDKM